MEKIYQKLKRLKKSELEKVCRNLYLQQVIKIRTGTKNEIISRLLQPLKRKYNMKSVEDRKKRNKKRREKKKLRKLKKKQKKVLRKVDKLPDKIRDLIQQFYPNLELDQALDRLKDLPPDLQRKIALHHKLAHRIEEEDLDMNEEIEEALPGDSENYAEQWNENHPDGPWWNKIECDHCDNFQWFLTYDGEDSRQPAYDWAEWENADNIILCPECVRNPGIFGRCDACGQRFYGDDLVELLDDDIEYTGNNYCGDCYLEVLEDQEEQEEQEEQ